MLIAAALASVLILLIPMEAAAQQRPPEPVDSRLLTGVFAPDPESVWRRISRADSTSQCIGEPLTPLCTIETYHACFVRRIAELCQVATAHFLGEPIRFHSRGHENHYVIYRVVAVRRATADDVRSGRKGINLRYIGDLLVDIDWQPCWKNDLTNECTNRTAPTTYTLRRYKERWVIVDLHMPRR